MGEKQENEYLLLEYDHVFQDLVTTQASPRSTSFLYMFSIAWGLHSAEALVSYTAISKGLTYHKNNLTVWERTTASGNFCKIAISITSGLNHRTKRYAISLDYG